MNLPSDVLEKLKRYESLLVKWQAKINLVSPNTINNAWQRHFEDSIQINSLLPKGAQTLFDLGCGAGFPGLILAMINPDLDVHLVESDQKKCSFLKTVSRETETKVMIHNCRIEELSVDVIPDIITARALADLPKLFDYCAPWIGANHALALVFPKGRAADRELDLLKEGWNFEHESCKSVTDQQARILKFTDVKKLL